MLMETKDKDSWREKWPDAEMNECVEVVYDTADMAQRMLKTAHIRTVAAQATRKGTRMNLLEETLSDIENCGYATGDVLYVGGEDGRVQMTWEQAEPILDVDYNDDYGLAEIVEDLCVRFKDGAMLIRHEYDGKEWWRFVPAPAKHGVPFKIVKSECGSLADVNYPMGIPDTKEEA